MLCMLCHAVQLDEAGAAKAIQALDGSTFDGRQLRVRGQEPQ